MRRTTLVNALRANGYWTLRQDDVVNGKTIKKIAVTLDNGCGLVINQNHFKTVGEVLALLDQYKDDYAYARDLFDKESAAQDMRVGLRQKSGRKDICRDTAFDGIEEYIYLARERKDGTGYAVLSVDKAYLDKIGMSENEAWERAEENSEEFYIIDTFGAGMFGDDDTGLYLATSTDHFRGASAILSKRIREEFGKKFNTTKIVVIPSSIHECLMFPYGKFKKEDFQSFLPALIGNVNETIVEAEEVLGTKPYLINIEGEVLEWT